MRFFQGFSSKAKVSSTIEKNDLYIFQKMLPINIKTLLKGIQSGEIEGNMDEDFHVNSDDYALEHNIFGRPLGGGKPEIDDKLVAGSEFVFDFFIGDDVNTVLDSEARLQDRILAGISIVPAGKVLKLARKIKNVDKVVDGGKDVKKGIKGTDELNDIIKNGKKMPKHSEVKNKNSLPGKGEPNSSIDLLNPNGTVKQRRYYDENGRAKEDIDFNHPDDGTHTFPHRHKWDWSKTS
ncbi:hypothetical protein [Metabacillus niabensis]|nr:hypothetical protein [Metabacillus niabensis]